MAERKAVLFNFWGVAVSSRLRAVFHKFEQLHNLPGGFLSSVASQKDSAMSRAERGEITLSQMIPAFEEECVTKQVKGLTLPSDWSISGLLEELREAMMDVQPAVLKTAASLRHSGLLTAVLANHWVDDSAARDSQARLLCQLGCHFDLIHQSCRTGHRVPEPAMFNSALQHLGVTSQQAVWLDADEEGVKAAEGVGMKAILVENLDDALNKLAIFTGVQAIGAESPPPSCSPDEVSHGYVTIKPGVRTHYVEMGSGPPVLLCHGFPESWYSWRFQIPALAAAGFRVLALDMKGYGESTAPPGGLPAVAFCCNGSLWWTLAGTTTRASGCCVFCPAFLQQLEADWLPPSFTRLKAAALRQESSLLCFHQMKTAVVSCEGDLGHKRPEDTLTELLTQPRHFQ